MFEWRDFLTAIALLLILEGLLPMTMPRQWRALLNRFLASIDDSGVRFIGAVGVAAGLLLLSLVR